MSGKHTPGPWVVTGVSMTTGNVSVGAKDQRIIIADVTNAASFGDMVAGAMKRGSAGFHPSDCDTQFANAQLIATAPDMAEALKGLISAIGDWSRPTGANGMTSVRPEHPLLVAAGKARSVLSKSGA